MSTAEAWLISFVRSVLSIITRKRCCVHSFLQPQRKLGDNDISSDILAWKIVIPLGKCDIAIRIKRLPAVTVIRKRTGIWMFNVLCKDMTKSYIRFLRYTAVTNPFFWFLSVGKYKGKQMHRPNDFRNAAGCADI